MRNVFLLTIIFFVFSNSSKSQLTDYSKFENSLLWEISGNNLKSPSFILGTIHMIHKDNYFFPKYWDEKLKSCKKLALEVDMDISPLAQLRLAMQTMLPKGTTIENYMPDEHFLKLKSFLLDTLKISKNKYSSIISMKPFFAYSLILNELIGKKIELYEMNLISKAKKYKLDIFGLETIEYQMSIIDSVPYQKQVEMFFINDTISKSMFLTDFRRMELLYKSQNIEKLYEETIKEQSFGEFSDSFIFQRNEKWTEILDIELHNSKVFVAVGAGHLAGEKGLLNLLRNKGYVLKPVFE